MEPHFLLSELCAATLGQSRRKPSSGTILCSERDAAVAHYSLESLGNTVLAREYELALPDEHRLAERLASTRHRLLSSWTEKR